MATTLIPAALSLVDLRRRLSAGQSAQDVLEKVLDVYITHHRERALLIVECISFLSDNGARVATGQSECALARILDSAACENPSFIAEVVRRLAKKPGELPFHVLAKYGPLMLSAQDLTNQDLHASLHARDSDGRTVSHYLWDPQGAIVAYRQAADRATLITRFPLREKWLATRRNAWEAQEKLHNMGFSLDLPDHQGRTALDACVDRLEAEDITLLSSMGVSQLVQVHQVRRAMRIETPLADTQTTPLPGPRF